MQTNVPGIYAIGDVTGPPLLAHAAMAQGVLVAEAIAGHETRPLIREDIPRAVYCHPQVASMGITEAQATERGIGVNVGRFPYRANGKALSLGDYAGLIKVVSDAETGALLGAQMVGPECAELLGELSVAKMLEATPLEIGRAIHPHPTLSRNSDGGITGSFRRGHTHVDSVYGGRPPVSTTTDLSIPRSELLTMLRTMKLIRRFEERSAEHYARGNIGGFLHLYIGEEAVAVGVISPLRDDDKVVTHYRDHGHALARGLDVAACMAELFGKSTGLNGGKGGSMHFFDVEKGFMGGHAIVGAQMPFAVGLAFANRYRGQDSLVVCFLGDGAVNEGEFHESMNLASLWKLPVLFLLGEQRVRHGNPRRTRLGSADYSSAGRPAQHPQSPRGQRAGCVCGAGCRDGRHRAHQGGERPVFP